MTSTNGKRTAARKRETRDFRYGLCAEVGRCEVCLKPKPVTKLCCHEILCGTGYRSKALDQPYALLVVADCCHAIVQAESKVRQLARLYLADAGRYDLKAYLHLRNPKAPDAIVQREVDAEIRAILQGR